MTDALDRPIFLIGAARSGTTVLAELLATHPDIAYWSEPRYVWRHGAAGRLDDHRDVAEATPGVSDHIRGQFSRHVQRHGGIRFLEKTPGNCFRVEFMAAVFPDARFIHLMRNGRDCSASAFHRWCSPPDDAAILRRLKNFEIPLRDLITYAPDALREIVLRRMQPERGHLWGPRYPGIHDDIKSMDTASVCAWQWVNSVQSAKKGLDTAPTDRVFSLDYASLLGDPRRTVEALLEFSQLPRDSGLLDAAESTLKSTSDRAWRKLTAAQQASIATIVDPLNHALRLATHREAQNS